MNILVVTDAWYPQVNGVVRTIATIRDEIRKLGHTVEVIGPEHFRTIPMPTYPEIRLAIAAGRKLCRMIVDLVQTGSTLRANGLVETETIATVTSRLIVNRTALKTQPERVGAWIARFRAALGETA